MPNSEMLSVVEDMARRLLTEDEVVAVMQMCRKVRSCAHSCKQNYSSFEAVLTGESVICSMWQRGQWRT